MYNYFNVNNNQNKSKIKIRELMKIIRDKLLD